MKKLLLILLCLPFIGFGQDFIQIQNTSFSNFSYSSIAFSDIDNDGDEDVLITGYYTSCITELFINDGLGNFSLVTGTPFTGVSSASIVFSDVENDGDEDVLISGWDNNGVSLSELYTNDGLGNFSLVTNTSFPGVYEGSIAFSDVDNDGYEDVLISGWEFANSGKTLELYINDGLGNFSLLTGTPFNGIGNSSVAFSDVDNDGYVDILITGWDVSWNHITKLYKNSTDSTINPSWDCNLATGVCFDPQDGSGPYSTELACLDSCVNPSWD